MRKTVLMLILCAPLLWTTWQEGRRLYEVLTWVPQPSPSEDSEAATKAAKLAKLQAKADAIVKLPDEVVATVVRLDPAQPGFGEGPIEKELHPHVMARDRARQMIEEAKLEADGVEQKIQENLKRLRAARGRPQDQRDPINALDKLLNTYGGLPVHVPDLLLSARAEKAWPELEVKHPRQELEDLYDKLDRWTPGAAEADLPTADQVTRHADAYRQYIEDYGLAKESFAVSALEEARERLALWERAARLVRLLSDATSPPDKQIEGIATMAEAHSPARFEKTARRLVRALSGSFLKPELLDTVVYLIGKDNPPEKIARKDVRVNLKSGGDFPLGPPGDDEYKLKSDQVDFFDLPMGRIHEPARDTNLAPLKGTVYSDAVRDFNDARSRVKSWSEPELMKLRETCVAHKADLEQGAGENPGGRTLIERIDRLLTIVRKHPNLFVASEL